MAQRKHCSLASNSIYIETRESRAEKKMFPFPSSPFLTVVKTADVTSAKVLTVCFV